MPTFTVGALRARAKLFTSLGNSAAEILSDFAKKQSSSARYDIFLSHSLDDPELLLGAKLTLQDYGYKVNLDWPDNPQEDRNKITPEAAQLLKDRMDLCKSLLFITTSARSECKWLPWVCGYFEGSKGKAAVLPMTPTNSDIYQGQDYLGIYPYIAKFDLQNQNRSILVVRYGVKTYCTFDDWLNGVEPVSI